MLVPVTPSDGLVSDVNLLGVIRLAGTQRLIVGSAVRESRSLRGLGSRS